MTVTATDTRERRQYRRFPAANLKAQWRKKKGLFTDWVDVEVLDFSSHGIALAFEEEPEIDELTIRLILEMDMGDIKVDRIDALARNRSSVGDIWRVGCEFILDSSQAKKDDIENKLEKIARLLEKSTAVNERLKKQMSEANH